MNKKVLVFARNPVLGKVKTRLAADIGQSEALEVYKNLLSHTIQVLESQSSEPIFYFDKLPSTQLNSWPHKVQSEGDLGIKISDAIENELPGSLVIIGSDCPEISPAIIQRAFEGLRFQDVVVGPAEDGGFYLLAVKEDYPKLFDGIDWSTEKVCGQLMQNIDRLKLNYLMLEALRDVDTLSDLQATAFEIENVEFK